MFFIYTVINGLIILKTLVNPIIYAARMHEIKVNWPCQQSMYKCMQSNAHLHTHLKIISHRMTGI